MFFPFFFGRNGGNLHPGGSHPSEVQDLANELASYDRDFETAKIWVGKQARQNMGNTVGYGWEKGHGIHRPPW